MGSQQRMPGICQQRRAGFHRDQVAGCQSRPLPVRVHQRQFQPGQARPRIVGMVQENLFEARPIVGIPLFGREAQVVDEPHRHSRPLLRTQLAEPVHHGLRFIRVTGDGQRPCEMQQRL